MNNKYVFTYNKDGEPSAYFWPFAKVMYKYIYFTNGGLKFRKWYCYCGGNYSNFYSILKQVLNPDNTWSTRSKLEVGQKYIMYSRYDINNDEVFSKRINKETRSFFIQNTIFKSNSKKVWMTNHNGKTSMGFQVDKSKI